MERAWLLLARAQSAPRPPASSRASTAAGFRDDFDAVLALPGIGRSTAAAICVFAFGARHAILDGNVKRVLARCFGIAGYPGEKRVANDLWRRADALLPGAISKPIRRA